ncbi:MAG TPA: ROK family protein [Ktedonobacteraceae bacterium]|nr:ROK family protein [Ktedonobacteraceae bacterium]
MPDHREKTDKQVAIGIEITRHRATIGLVDQYSKIHHRIHVKTLRGRPAFATLEPYLDALENALFYAKAKRLHVSGLGISIPGTLDSTARRPRTIPVLPALNTFPLCDLLEARYNLPVQLHVDVDAALLGEYHFGAGQGYRRLLFLNVSTVVGAAVFRDGQLEITEQSSVGHACHIVISMSGPRCSCGKYGCINTLISMEAIQKMLQRALRREERSNLIQRLSSGEKFGPQLLAEEALCGDPIALYVYCEVGRWVGAATARYINMYEPEILILGGEVLGAKELLIANIRNSLMTQSSANNGDMLKIVPSQLGSDAALIGAVSSYFHE